MFGVQRHAVVGGDRRSPRGRRYTFGPINLWQVPVCLGVLVAALFATSAHADDELMLSYRNPIHRPDNMSLWDAPRAASSLAAEITLDLKSFCELCVGSYEISFFHTIRRTERRAAISQTTLHAGFGQFFPDHPVVPLSTSGAGIEDLRWIYVKLCIRF